MSSPRRYSQNNLKNECGKELQAYYDVLTHKIEKALAKNESHKVRVLTNVQKLLSDIKATSDNFRSSKLLQEINNEFIAGLNSVNPNATSIKEAAEVRSPTVTAVLGYANKNLEDSFNKFNKFVGNLAKINQDNFNKILGSSQTHDDTEYIQGLLAMTSCTMLYEFFKAGYVSSDQSDKCKLMKDFLDTINTITADSTKEFIDRFMNSVINFVGGLEFITQQKNADAVRLINADRGKWNAIINKTILPMVGDVCNKLNIENPLLDNAYLEHAVIIKAAAIEVKERRDQLVEIDDLIRRNTIKDEPWHNVRLTALKNQSLVRIDQLIQKHDLLEGDFEMNKRVSVYNKSQDNLKKPLPCPNNSNPSADNFIDAKNQIYNNKKPSYSAGF